MARHWALGCWHYTWCRLTRPYKVGQWSPRRETYYVVLTRLVTYTYRYMPYCGGMRLHCAVDACTLQYLQKPNWHPEWVVPVKKRERLGLTAATVAGASPLSTLLPKLPLIREWCSCTVYEDGTARLPGALRITTRGQAWTLTLTDPDSAARLCASDASLDKALQLLEQWLGVAEAPWELDPWAQSRGAKKGKK